MRVHLVSMPFADLAAPSLALTQLRAVTQSRLGSHVTVRMAYLTHDFGQFLGVETYQAVCNASHSRDAGLGDWFFRAAAFPDQPDNTGEYLDRFFPVSERPAFVTQLMARRSWLDSYLDELIDRYQLDDNDIVGFTSMFMQNVASFAVARKLKDRNPRVVTVMGGANCEYPMGRVIAREIPWIDYVFSGPSLETFPEFVARRAGVAPSKTPLPGVFSKDAAVSDRADELGADLPIDVNIALDYDAFMSRLTGYFGGDTLTPIVPIETSRGCWWGQRAHCTFCGLNGSSMAYRSMAPEQAIDQLRSAFRYRGLARVVQAVDNIMPTHYPDAVFSHVEAPIDMSIFYEVKADLPARQMATMARAGVRLLQPGIEALATSTLKLMRKGTTAFQNVLFLENCVTYGMTPYWNLLIGFPGESEDTYRRYAELIPLLTHLCPPTGVYPVRFDRYSPYHRDADAFGLDLQPMAFYPAIYPLSETALSDLAYYFTDRHGDAAYRRAADAWREPLQSLIDRWRNRWADAFSEAPALGFESNTNVVRDSRSGSTVRHHLDDVNIALLARAERPIAVDALIAQSSIAHADARRAIRQLEGLGLLFREGERVLSLVLRPAPFDEVTSEAGDDEVQHVPIPGAMPAGTTAVRFLKVAP